MQQSLHTNAEAVIKYYRLLFKCDDYIKSIPYHSERNLPALVSAPGAKVAQAYISKHFIPWNKAYLF